MKKSPLDAEISTTLAAELLKVTPRRVRQLCEAGDVERLPDDRVTIRGVVRGFLDFWQRGDKRQEKRDAEGRRSREAKSRTIELRNAQLEAELVPLVEAHDAVAEVQNS